jgi:hypothetical protein
LVTFTTTLRRPLDNVRDEMATWRAKRARKKRERRWKRKESARSKGGMKLCVRQLHRQLWEEHLQQVMTARICDARIAELAHLVSMRCTGQGSKLLTIVHRNNV